MAINDAELGPHKNNSTPSDEDTIHADFVANKSRQVESANAVGKILIATNPQKKTLWLFQIWSSMTLAVLLKSLGLAHFLTSRKVVDLSFFDLAIWSKIKSFSL